MRALIAVCGEAARRNLVDDVVPGCAGTSTADLVVADEGYRSLCASLPSRPLLAGAVVVNVPENQNEP
jgi:hypothetical protein